MIPKLAQAFSLCKFNQSRAKPVNALPAGPKQQAHTYEIRSKASISFASLFCQPTTPSRVAGRKFLRLSPHADKSSPESVDELRSTLFKFAQAESLCHLAFIDVRGPSGHLCRNRKTGKVLFRAIRKAHRRKRLCHIGLSSFSVRRSPVEHRLKACATWP